jgi:hypothetical protein
MQSGYKRPELAVSEGISLRLGAGKFFQVEGGSQ